MPLKAPTITSLVYFGNLWHYRSLHQPAAQLEYHEHFIPQTAHSQCYINTSQGLLCLSLPVIRARKTGSKTLITDVLLFEEKRHKTRHLRSLTTAYKNSPFFEYYEQDLKTLYQTESIYLYAWNFSCMQFVIKNLRTRPTFQPTLNYSKDYLHDFRVDQPTPPIPPSMEFSSTFPLQNYNKISILDWLFHTPISTLRSFILQENT